MTRTAILIATIACTVGCSQSKNEAVEKEVLLTQAATNFFADLPDTLASVNGTTLTRETAIAELDARAESLRNRLPPGEIEGAKIQILPKLVGAFVTRTLLEQEADRLQIDITDTELSNTLSRIEEQMGSDVEAFMEKSPMGADRMRAEVVKGLRVEKMLRQALSNETILVEGDVDAFIEANAESLQDPKTGEQMQREKIEAIVLKQKRDEALKAFVEALRRKADISIAPTFK